MKIIRKFYIYLLLFGTIGFPLFIPLDLIAYPDIKLKLIAVRLIISAISLIQLIFAYRIKEKYISFLIPLFSYFAALAMSIMCYLTGEGFSSLYNAGLYQVLIVVTILFYLKSTFFTLLMIIVIIQHFILLSFAGQFIFREFINALFSLGGFAIISILAHYLAFKTQSENVILKGLLPICANCKSIRDDKGYWNQIESYIHQHSEARFSHSLCPDCTKKLYPDIYDKIAGTGKTKGTGLHI